MNVYIIFLIVLIISFITGNIVLLIEYIQNKRKDKKL